MGGRFAVRSVLGKYCPQLGS
ncbi:hypothetical protein CITRIK5_70752 [Citricoccus sp. K5]|nr:hypothetical protein CITRIK5_70752 [Citricoccus sp. K5]